MYRQVICGFFTLTTVAMLSACGTGKQYAENVVTPESAVEEKNDSGNGVADVIKEVTEKEYLYADVDSDSPFYETIISAMDKGLLEGFISDSHFRPDDPLKNVDIPLLFWNLAGRPTPAEDSPTIANADEMNEEQVLAAQWYYQAYRGFMFTDAKEPEFFKPEEPALFASFGNARFLASERFGKDHQVFGGYTVVHLDEENSAQTITRAEAIKELDNLAQEYPVGTEFAKELPDDLMALVTECDPAKEPIQVAQAEPAKEPAKEQPAQTQSNTVQSPTPAQTQQTVPPPAPTPEEIAAAQAAQAQAAAEAAAAQAAAEAQAQAEAIAAAQAAAEAQAQAEAAAEAAAQAQAAAQATGNMSDPQWVRDQIASTAEAYGFTCSQPMPSGTGGTRTKITLQAIDHGNRKWKQIIVVRQPGGNWTAGARTYLVGDAEDSNPSSVDEIKSFIASHAH